LMDIDLPGTTGIECVAKLKQIKPQVQFLMCTNLEDDDSIFSALSLGATGYLIKNTTIERLSDSIKDIYSGGSPMSPQIARKVTQAFRKEREVSKLFEALTGREKEIVELLSQGYTYKLIADRLAIATDTVRTYIRNIYSKLQVHCRTDALNRLFPKIRRV
jgi:DNA-binding NarL/FixJ family response regulator